MVHPAGRTGRQPRPSAALASHSTLELAWELLNRIERDGIQRSMEVNFLGRLAAELDARTQQHPNRYARRHVASLFGQLRKHPDFDLGRLPGAVCVEVGCGSLNPLGRLMGLTLLGAGRCVGIDLEPMRFVAPAVRALYACIVDALTGVAELPLDPERARAHVAGFDLRKLAAGDPEGIDRSRLEFRVASADATGLEDRSVDVLASTSFLEHVADVDAVLAELRRVTKPGGLGLHSIDGFDHRHWGDARVHPLAFLREAPGERMVHSCNRLRPLQFRPAFERHGFAVVALQITDNDRVAVGDDLRRSLVEPFRSLPADHLEVAAAVLFVRRR